MSDLGPILITGSSSGLGQAAVRRLAERGELVYASARRPESLVDLARLGARTVGLDVTDEPSMRRVVADIVSEHGRVGALVNNAGYGEYGAIEEVPVDRIRRQFETNVIGLARMCQLVLPSMRAAGRGRIVNIGSMGGRLTFPFGGYYHATKHALEAFSDALRYEVAPWQIRVSLVEPGPMRTGFGTVISETMRTATAEDSPYRGAAMAFDDASAALYRNRLLAVRPEAVARTIEHALTSPRPLSRYVMARRTRLLITTRELLPGKAWDRLLRSIVR
jgi:NAD(P)-dependent dehydrogenase (short-subunit alcohol dehydrogenase family)